MKKRFYSLIALMMALCMLLLCAGCGKSNAVAAEDYAPEAYFSDYGTDSADAAFSLEYKSSGVLSGDNDGEQGVTESNLKLGETDPTRKLVYTVSYNLETKTFDASVDTMLTLSAGLGGYTESSSVIGIAAKNARQGTYVLRIPTEHLQSFIDQVGTVGSISSESMTTKDVTLDYVDTESRLKTLRTQQERLTAMLAESATVSELIEVQNALADVEYEIESYTSQLNTLKDEVNYSTVNIVLSEVIDYTPVEPEVKTFWEELAETFNDCLMRIGNGLEDFAIWFFGNFLEIVLWLGLIAGSVLLTVVIIRGSIRKSRKKRARRAAAAAAAAAAAKATAGGQNQ